MLTITETRTLKVPVLCVSFQWDGTLYNGPWVRWFRCDACRGSLVGRRMGTAVVRDDMGERTLRLCRGCGMVAEQDLTRADGVDAIRRRTERR
jgi:hypothetical protein